MRNILSALNRIPCAEMTHDEWIRVGMALKNEGFEAGIWDAWSATDPARYHAGECEKRWQSFKGCENPVTGATIIRMAKDRGWTPMKGEDGVMDWNDEIEYDGEAGGPEKQETGRRATEDLILYMRTLFKPEEYVGYVTGDVWQTEDGKWAPSKGVYHRTAGELIASLKRYPEDIGATVGDWKPEAGAWIRFNPLDGKGVRNENVTAYRYALVESDSMRIEDQIALYRKYELPIAALVHSGNKSVHAIVRVDAENYEEYRQRVTFLYDFLSSRGVQVDTQNRNPSRLSRMPGVTRNGKTQKLIGINMGRKNWMDWMDFAEGITDQLPEMRVSTEAYDHPLTVPEELIAGVLRRGHKMLISGSSKAGKSFLLMELAAAIGAGGTWLGFRCRKGKVLYINLEIDPASCEQRFVKICTMLGYRRQEMENVIFWHLRGKAMPLDQLVPKLVRRVRNMGLDAIIIDPIYKVITGDENSASDMAAFCNQFDRICSETGCAAIYCHHHSKGAQGAKRAMDRASGSGVFARDPDAQLDMIELEMDETTRNWSAGSGVTAWRLECSLREFPNFKPVNFWFRYPVHGVDQEGTLKDLMASGALTAGRMLNGKNKPLSKCAEEMRIAFGVLNLDGNGVPVKQMSNYLGIAQRTVRDRIGKMEGEFYLDNGTIKMV